MARQQGRETRAWRNLRSKTLAEARRLKKPCALCGQPINYRADPRAWDAPSVDHIRSWKHHPELRLDPGNLQIAHQACNSSKGVGQQGPPSIGNQSRDWSNPSG